MNCLQNVLGITRAECKCVTDALKPKAGSGLAADWYKASTSGLFLDEVEGIYPLNAQHTNSGCCGELAEFYVNAIETAKTLLQDDLIQKFSERYRQAQKMYSGQAGSFNFTDNQPVSGTWAGIWINSNQLIGGKIKIKAIHTLFSAAGTITLKLYRRPFGANYLEFVQDITNVGTNLNAMASTNLPSPVELDMADHSYFLLYDTTGLQPKNNPVSCGCGYTENIFKTFATLVGVNGTDLNYFPNWSQQANAFGLALTLEIGCDASNIICSMYNADLSYQKVMAHAIRFRAAAIVHERILSSTRINIWTLQSREHLYGKRNHFIAEYEQRIQWFANQTDVSRVSNCFICNTDHKAISKTGILV